MSLRLMLVDDHTILRETLRSSLEQEGDIQVVAESSDGKDLVSLAQRCKPDVVLMDINLPGTNGIDLTRNLRQELPEIKVVALSTFSEQRIMLKMLEAGASGYVIKSAGRAELLRTIRSVAKGYISPAPDLLPVITGK